MVVDPQFAVQEMQLFQAGVVVGRILAAGLEPALAPRVNLGNVHFSPGRRPVTPSVFLGAEDLSALRTLARAGFEIEARAIPSEPPAGMAEIERRYGATP